MTARAWRRSNVVGASSPTSTPRWPSRHRLASGKRERPGLAVHDLWRRSTHGLLREVRAECAAPLTQRGPYAGPCDRQRPRADPPPDLADRRPHDEPQREGEGDRRVAIVPSRAHAPRHQSAPRRRPCSDSGGTTASASSTRRRRPRGRGAGARARRARAGPARAPARDWAHRTRTHAAEPGLPAVVSPTSA